MSTRQTTPNILDDVLAAKQETGPVLLPLADVKRDGGMQPRAGVDMVYVAELVEAMASGANLPPVDVTYDGSGYWLWDGYHRFEACAQLGMTQIAARVRQGDQASAQWDSFAANQAHGLRRTNADKERAIRAALRHAQGQQLSNREIGRHLGVDDKTIAKYREEMTTAQEIPQVTRRQGADGKSYDTTKMAPALPRAFVAVWSIEKYVSAVYQDAYLASEEGNAYATRDMRAGAKQHSGRFWQLCIEELARNGHKETSYRISDLAQAINNVAEQIEVKLRTQAVAPPEPKPTPVADEERVYVAVNGHKPTEPDPWVAACRHVGSRQSVCEKLARAIMPWLREYRDSFGRGWEEIAERGNVAHTNSTLWQDIMKERERRGAPLLESYFKDAIKQAFDWLAAERKLAQHQVEDEPATRLDDLPVVATTGPVSFTVNGGPLPAWVEMEPGVEPSPDDQPDLATTNHDLYLRQFQLGIWRRSFQGALDELDKWAEATGHFTATLDAERGLRLMVELTDNELAALAA